jgi:hypothetical protein
VNSFLEEYIAANSIKAKSQVVAKVMSIIQEACPVGAFVKYEDGRWWEMDRRTAREKVGSYFRDCLHYQYRSSAKNKIARRKIQRHQSGGGGDSENVCTTSTASSSWSGPISTGGSR